ncbi:MAG: hypothetical protein ACX93O_04020 [Flagellimonas sp.]
MIYPFRCEQAGLRLCPDQDNWIGTGIDFVSEDYNSVPVDPMDKATVVGYPYACVHIVTADYWEGRGLLPYTTWLTPLYG